MEKMKLKISNLYLYSDDLIELHKIADQQRIPYAVLVRDIMHKYVVKHKVKND